MKSLRRVRAVRPPLAMARPYGGSFGAAFLLVACGLAGIPAGSEGREEFRCEGHLLNLPAEPVVVEARGSLRCSREAAIEGSSGEQARVGESIEYGPMSCVSGCPEGYTEQWTMLRVELHPDGTVLEGDQVVGHLDEAGCFRHRMGSSIVRWDSGGTLRSESADHPLAVRFRGGRLELESSDAIDRVVTVEGEQLVVDGAPCGTIAGPPGAATPELALRVMLLPDFARLSALGAVPER